MTTERADLSGSLRLEEMAPVSSVPGVQGQATPGGGEGTPRRRPPPEETSAEPLEEDRDQPQHRVDSLA